MADENLKHIVRVANTDLVGTKAIAYALTKIKGVSFSLARNLCILTNIPFDTKAGALEDKQVQALDALTKNLESLPVWMFNRRKDMDTGKDKHLLTADLDFTKSNDIKFMRMIRSYKGARHSTGQPVRGQRTKGHFRKNTGVGVVKKKVRSGK